LGNKHIGFAKVWQGIVISAVVLYQLWLGAGLILKMFSIILVILFLNSIATGQTNFKFQTFAKPNNVSGQLDKPHV
jgi:hypothetical protein